MPKILCLDPGHGGYDPGCVGGCEEKDFTLNVCLDLKKALEARGVTVVMTRTSDVSPSGTANVQEDLQARCDISDQAGADLFLSIHGNSGGGVGTEAYIWPGGQAATIATDLVNALAPIMGVHGEAVKDGGPNGRHLAVICGTAAPAVLLEVGFLDSSDFAKLAARLHDFGDILAAPLSRFLGGSAPVVTPPNTVTPETLHAALEAHTTATDAKVAEALAALQAQFDSTIKALITELKG